MHELHVEWASGISNPAQEMEKGLPARYAIVRYYTKANAGRAVQRLHEKYRTSSGSMLTVKFSLLPGCHDHKPLKAAKSFELARHFLGFASVSCCIDSWRLFGEAVVGSAPDMGDTAPEDCEIYPCFSVYDVDGNEDGIVWPGSKDSHIAPEGAPAKRARIATPADAEPNGQAEAGPAEIWHCEVTVSFGTFLNRSLRSLSQSCWLWLHHDYRRAAILKQGCQPLFVWCVL